MSRSIKIRASQLSHIEHNIDALDNYGLYVDTSSMGTGKTVCGIESVVKRQANIEDDRKINIFVVGTTDAKDVKLSPWYRDAKKTLFDPNLMKVCSYEDIRGSRPTRKSKKQFEWTPKQLEYNIGFNILDVVSTFSGTEANPEKGKWVNHYYCTEEWITYCEENSVFLVFDEAHKLKNASDQNKAGHALVYGLLQAKKKNPLCCYALLTATPFDKPECAKNFFNLMNVVDTEEDSISIERPGKEENDGLMKIIKRCKKFDEIAGENLIDDIIYMHDIYKYNKKGKLVVNPSGKKNSVVDFVFDLFITCILKRVHSAMYDGIKRQVYMGFYNITQKRIEL